ncbi:hypothetical protein [Brevundimonas diminuta]|uniref:hypothetical protein n=1 Tax=Brevundimonas diminuta TaxID=293 RepID=UPI001178CADB|nr:hypothetical protein [Brevundimonas diminuta]
MTHPTRPQSLVDAAFAHALAKTTRAIFFSEIIPDFRRSSPGREFADALVSRPSALKSNGVRPRPRVRIRERSDGAGLALIWRIGTGTKRTTATWADLIDLPCPEGADPVAAAVAHQMAVTIWTKATRDFESEIRGGSVALMGRLGSPFEECGRIPESALAHVQIDDWLLGTGSAAGTRLFDLAVVPELDPSAAYLAKVHAAGKVWTKLLPVIIGKLFPTGIPDRSLLSNKDFCDALGGELKRLGLTQPDNRTYDRARKASEKTTLDN